jgi:hypothetical protein
MGLREDHDAYVQLCEVGQTLEAIERYYAEDVCVFENRALARAGRATCLEAERRAVEKQAVAPWMVAKSRAVDERTGTSFVEWVIRFVEDGTPMRLEEVARQRWAGGRIIEERFYYEGIVDESDVDEPVR